MTTNQQLKANLPHEFAHAAMDLVSGLIPTSTLNFYFIDPHIQLKGFVGINDDPELEKAYNAKFWLLDPLSPRHFKDSDISVACSNTTIPNQQWVQTAFYRDFLAPQGFMHCADLFFRNDEDIIAALLTTRARDLGSYKKHELALLQGAQRFIEFALNKSYLPPRVSERQFVAQKYGLTKRELDVLECAMTGLSNKAICKELTISLPTLRTHLHHIYNKVDVSGTNELISRIFRELVASKS